MPVELLKEYNKIGEDLLAKTGLPDLKTEHWRKFDISPISNGNFPDAPSPIGEPKEQGSKILFVNGVLALSEERRLELSERYIYSRDLQKLGAAGDERGSYYYHVNSSRITDFTVITVKAGEKRDPLYLSQRVEGIGGSVSAHSRIVIELEEGAELDLIQDFNSTGDQPVFHNSVTEILMGKNSTLHHLILQEEKDNVHVFNHLYVRQSGDSRYRGTNLIAGGALSRNEYHISLKEEGCEASVDSFYLGKGQRNHNSDITIYHDAPHCSSRTETRAVAGDESLGTFRGFAIIAKDSQKSDAIQQFKTILLNDKAQVNMEPHLEIWADDVTCSHGATVGQLDEQQLFYLQTRGFTEEQARKILLEGFASRIFENLEIGDAGRAVQKRVFALMEGFYEQG
jgi:Fe-S cluster assembly protein SufD